MATDTQRDSHSWLWATDFGETLHQFNQSNGVHLIITGLMLIENENMFEFSLFH